MRKFVTIAVLAAAFSSIANAESAWTMLEKGIRQLEKKRYDRAEAYFHAAVRMDSRCVDANYYLGVIYQKKGSHKVAEQLFNKVTKDAPTFHLACGRIGHIAMKKGDLKTAEEKFTVLADKQPTSQSWMQVAAVQLSRERYKEAEASLTTASKFSKGNLDIVELKARLFMETKRFDEALDCYTEILSKIPIDSTARYLRGVCLKELNREDEARKEWETVIEKDPWNRRTLEALVEMYKDDPSREKTVLVYSKRIEILKKNPPRVRRVSGKKK